MTEIDAAIAAAVRSLMGMFPEAVFVTVRLDADGVRNTNVVEFEWSVVLQFRGGHSVSAKDADLGVAVAKGMDAGKKIQAALGPDPAFAAVALLRRFVNQN